MTLHDDALNQPSGNSAQGSPISSLWWLAVATVLLYLAGGNHPIALAAWLAPVCLVRFVRMQPALRGIAVAYVVLAVTNGIVMRDMVPVPGVGYYIFVVISGVSAVLPNVVDRLLAPRLKGFAGTLVFPATLVAIQFANSFGPYGSWGTLAYTQSGNLPLLQSLAVTGLWGIVFLIGWFAGIVNYALQEGLRTRPAMRALAVFGGVFLLVVAAGEAWLALAPPPRRPYAWRRCRRSSSPSVWTRSSAAKWSRRTSCNSKRPPRPRKTTCLKEARARLKPVQKSSSGRKPPCTS